MKTRKRTAGSIVALAAAGLMSQGLVAPSASAQATGCTDHDRYTVCTTLPAAGETDPSIAKEIGKHIDQTKRGDSVNAAVYLWETGDGRDESSVLSHKIVQAAARGVNVRVVLGDPRDKDGEARNSATRTYFTLHGIPVNTCADSCIVKTPGGKGAMHNKFFTINGDGYSKVIQTSSNFSENQLKIPQNMLVTRNDHNLFNHYDAYWDRLYDRSWNGWNDKDKRKLGDYDDSKSYVFPRESTDPVAGILSNVSKCEGGRDKVWLAASLVKGREAVRKQLIRLEKDRNCDVRVIVPDDEEKPGTSSHEWHMQQPVDGRSLDKKKVRNMGHTHNKFMLIDAEYAGSEGPVVFTGSHNLTDSNLKYSDDAMIRLSQPGVINRFVDYFTSMWQKSVV